MRVKMKPVKVFEVVGRTGRLENLQQIGAEWNNMVELQDDKGASLVLMREGGFLSAAISEILKDGASDWTVISGAPKLLNTLGLQQPEADGRSLEEMLLGLRAARDMQPAGEARSALNDACDRLDVAVSKLRA